MAIEGRVIGLGSGRVKYGSLCFPAFVLALLAASEGHGQTSSGGGQVTTPQSTIEKPGDIGVRAHTNIQIFTPNRGPDGTQAPQGGPAGGTPQAPGAERAGGGARPQ